MTNIASDYLWCIFPLEELPVGVTFVTKKLLHGVHDGVQVEPLGDRFHIGEAQPDKPTKILLIQNGEPRQHVTSPASVSINISA